MHRGNRGRTRYAVVSIQGYPSNLNGFCTPPRFCNGPGVSPTRMLTSKITTPESQARGRHLLDGSLPSGNSKNTNVPSSPTVGTHMKLFTPATPTGNGTVPGLATP